MKEKISHLYNKALHDRKKLIIVSIFTLLFILGISFIPKLNVNFDTIIEQRILRSNVKNYSKLIGLNKLTEYYDKLDVPFISEDVEKDHGVSAYYLFTPFLLLNYISPIYTIYMWYFYTFIIFFIGVIYFYRLIYYLFKSRRISTISSLLYVSCPRLFIDGIHNNKDIVLMSLLVIMIFYGLKMIDEKNKKNMILFSLVSGFVCNTKIIGLYFLGIIGLCFILNLFIKKEWSKRNILYGLTVAFLSIIGYLLLTPAIWGNGKLEIVEFIKYCFKNSVSFRADPIVLFEGELYQNSIKSLPFYYIPKMILITIPIISSLLFCFGTINVIIQNIKNLFNRKKDFLIISLFCILIMLLIPLIIAMTSHPVLYNGWRHFYFLYSLIMIISSYGFFVLFNKNKRFNKVISLLCVFTILTNIGYLLKYNVANTAYYNILINRKNIQERYQLDYYEITTKQAISSFVKSNKIKDNKGIYYFYGDGFNKRILNDYFTIFDSEYDRKFYIVNDEELDELLNDGNVIYLFNNPIYSLKDFKKYKKIYSYKIFDSNIIDFYELKIK